MSTQYQCPEGLDPDGTINPQWLMAGPMPSGARERGSAPPPATLEDPAAGFEIFLGLGTPPGAESLPGLQSSAMGSLGSPLTSDFESPATLASPPEFMSDISTDTEFINPAQPLFSCTETADASHVDFMSVSEVDATFNDIASLDLMAGMMSHSQGLGPEVQRNIQDYYRRADIFQAIDLGSLDERTIHAASAKLGNQPVTQNDHLPMQTLHQDGKPVIDSNGIFKCLYIKKDGHVCGKQFNTPVKYNKHKKIHDKRKVCEICGKTVAGGKDLDRHKDANHKPTGERKVHPCPYCPQKITAREDNLRRHIKRKHPGV